MLVIFGTRGRISTTDGGRFYCPRCSGDRDYTRKGVRRWFTLFFIPIVPMGAARNVHVVCSTCNGAFNEQVLTFPRDLPSRRSSVEPSANVPRRC
jgi:hypothetical protein